jgi:predicted acylesterase/phospholipase RssA
MAKKRVALVLSGGISLGSYIAGALDELMRAFAAASDDYVIDIITGASAGATTGAIIAHGLLYRGGDTKLHDVWVHKLDMIDMLAPNMPQGDPLSLLSAGRLRQVAKETIVWDNPQDAGTRARFCADDLTLAMTLTNIDPLPYVSRIQLPAVHRKEDYVQYRHSEQETFYLGDQPPTHADWQRIAEVARASAAIPFVFPMVRLNRTPTQKTHYIQTPALTGPADFWYCDGGTFNNLPVDLAWHYIRRNDKDLEPQDRLLVVVDPSRNDISTVAPTAQPPALLPFAFKMITAHRNESSALQFDREIVLPSQQGHGDDEIRGAIPGIDRANIELLEQFRLVIPDRQAPPLYGSYFNALSAFLDQRFREYDYRRGAADANRVAHELLEIDYNSDRPPGFFEPDKDPSLQFDLSDYAALDTIPSTRDPSRSVRQVFEDALDGRIRAIVDVWNPWGPNIIASKLIEGFVHDQLPGMWPVR